MATQESAVLVELPGLNAIAQQKFDIPYYELSPSLQSVVREEAVRRAGNDMLAALKAVQSLLKAITQYSNSRMANDKEVNGLIDAAIHLAEGK